MNTDGPLLLFDEEVPRSGARVSAAYQYARWIDGSTHVWRGRRKDAGRGEGASGLRYDVVSSVSYAAGTLVIFDATVSERRRLC